ncbi:MAG: hypothetical protein OXU20_39870 [Myxococcales bacterium]|nr:hypothetical protein [Myxococcales bacterium]MDD9968039.1 hypothetical protein [Myxococcales bacterium]
MMSKFALPLSVVGLAVGLMGAATGCEDDPRDLDHLKDQVPSANGDGDGDMAGSSGSMDMGEDMGQGDMQPTPGGTGG